MYKKRETSVESKLQRADFREGQLKERRLRVIKQEGRGENYVESRYTLKTMTQSMTAEIEIAKAGFINRS